MKRIERYLLGTAVGGKEQNRSLTLPRSAHFVCVGASEDRRQAYVYITWYVYPYLQPEPSKERKYYMVALHHEHSGGGTFCGMVTLTTGEYFIFEDQSTYRE